MLAIRPLNATRRLAWPLFVLVPCLVWAGPFEQYYQEARANDPVFAAARAQYEADLESRAIGRSGLFPSLSYSALSARSDYERSELATPKVSKKYSYDNKSQTLQLAQPIFDLERWAAWREGDKRAQMAEVNFAEAQQDLALRYAQAYFDYLLARDTLELARAQKRALASQKVQAEHLFKGGSATITDVEETQARLQLAEAAELAAGSAVSVRLRLVEKLLGGRLSADLPKVGAFPLSPPEPAKPDAWLDAVASRNYKVQAQRLAEEVAGHQVDRAMSGHFPSASLVANSTHTTDPNYYTSKDATSSIGVQVVVPLFAGGKTTAQTRQAEAMRERTRQDAENMLRESQVKAGQFYLDLLNGLAQIQAMESAVRSSEVALKGMEAGQKVGFRTNTDVLNAQQQLFNVRRDLQKERYAYLMNRLQLQAIVGSLGEEEIQRIDSLMMGLSR